MLISFLQTITRPMFGSFETEEFKKFLRLGLIFATILGTYWTIRVLKNVVFFKLVGASSVPFAKTASLFTLFPLLLIYNKLLDRYPREHMFKILAVTYSILFLFVSTLLLITQAPQSVIQARTGIAYLATQSIGYSWYVITETFGSLVVALFWAIASDTTKPESAKKGFYFVTALGQIGSIIAPGLLSRLPKLLHLQTDAIILFVAALSAGSLYFLIQWFFNRTPTHLLESYNHGAINEKEIEEQKPGFFEGLKTLFTHTYLLGIFIVISIFEIITTIFDLNFDLLVSATHSGSDLTAYVGDFAMTVNIVSFICLIAGVGNITRYLGVSVALILMPIIICCALFGFISLHSLNFLFWLMVGSKAINYALNGPALKQLYIPTSKDARFKAQSWIETFGARSAKGSGSVFNMTLKPLQSRFGEVVGRAKYITFISWIGFTLIGAWLGVAYFLGRTYNKAIKEKKIIC